MAERALAIVAHPDDESFGCGGTLAKHVDAGDEVSVLVLADGVTSRAGASLIDSLSRKESLLRACDVLGIINVKQLGFPDQQLDARPLIELARTVESTIAEFKPTVVYTHWLGDINQDHRAVHNATNIACRPQPKCTVKRLLYFEIPCATGWGSAFTPNYFVDISDMLDRKRAAMNCYPQELREWPHARSVDAIAALGEWRGAMVGHPTSEAFVVGRIIE